MDTPETDSIADVPLPTSIRTVWRVVAIVQALVVIVGGVVLGVILESGILIAAVVGVVAVLLALRWWVIDLGFARFRWGVDDRWVERRSGVVIRTTQIVPRSRVQTLTTRTGPIDRWLGLSSIVIHTAGTHTPNLVIPHLEEASAERLRSELGGWATNSNGSGRTPSR